MSFASIGINYNNIGSVLLESSWVFCKKSITNVSVNAGRLLYNFLDRGCSLLGRTILHLQSKSSDEENKYRNFAVEGMRYTLKNVIFSSNNPLRHGYFNQNHKQEKPWIRKIKSKLSDTFLSRFIPQTNRSMHFNAIQKGVMDLREATSLHTLLHGDQREKLNQITHISNITEKMSLGNCAEMSCVLFKYFMSNSDIKRIDLMQIERGDHAFLVIGMNENVSENDLICDPWAAHDLNSIQDQIYPFSKRFGRLYSFVGVSSTYEPVIRLFSPYFQQIALVARYIRPEKVSGIYPFHLKLTQSKQI